MSERTIVDDVLCNM